MNQMWGRSSTLLRKYRVSNGHSNICTMFTKKVTLFLIVFISTIYLLIVMLGDRPIDVDREYQLGHMDEIIRKQASNLACKQPHLPIFPAELNKFLRNEPPLECQKAGPDWVKCEGSECHVQEKVKDLYGRIKCTFADVIRTSDFSYITNDTKTTTDSSYKLIKSDVVHVSCYSESNKWSATLTGIRHDPEVFARASWDKLPENAIKMNVLMFGLDSLSRNAFIRKLPRTYDYLTKVLGANVLQGYNIVGDGTPQALIPILTGKTELELPDTRKRKSGSKPVDVYPFIWNDFKAAGYVTAFLEDTPNTGIFTYRLNGFEKLPTDHYMRQYYVASDAEQSKWPKYCTGDIPRHQIMLNFIKDFYKVYKDKPKFLFGFHGELSHDDYNLIGVADNDLYTFFKDLKQSGALDNTILIVMADHGHRFAEIRNTIQGKQEERLPFFSFTFPDNFKKHFPMAYENFQMNIDKLTTPFDIYSTLKDVLSLENIGDANINQRSVSLFTKIPAERSCAHAYIEPHWCACLEWYSIPITSTISTRLAQSLIDKLNEYTESFRNMCEYLRLERIEWVNKMTPNQNLVKFKKNIDLDGFSADLTMDMEIKSEVYQIKILVLPGHSIFEASITHLLDEDQLEVNMKDISRVNMYGQQARCIEQEFPQLRKYCYCKD